MFLCVGMTCAACSGTIERCLNDREGVFSAKVSLLTETCEVIFDSKVVDIDEIVEDIEDVGFDAELQANDTKGTFYIEISGCYDEETAQEVVMRLFHQENVIDVDIASESKLTDQYLSPIYTIKLNVGEDARIRDITKSISAESPG